jgi:rare lipoprotein A (peptidoglycan hydrolase)
LKHLLLFLCVLAGAGCSSHPPHSSHEIEAFVRECEGIERRCELLNNRIKIINSRIIEGRSKCSYYSDYFEGKVTASGTRFSNHGRQIAHKSLPFGSMIFFRWVSDNRTSHGVVTDRGPFHRDPHGRYDRDFDITYKMATELGMVEQGVVEVNWIGLKGGVE